MRTGRRRREAMHRCGSTQRSSTARIWDGSASTAERKRGGNMQRNDEEQRAERLARSFLTGNISRRSFMARAAGCSTLDASATSLGAVLAACTSSSSTTTGSSAAPATGAPTAGGTLQAALTGELYTIDPATWTIYTGAQVYDNIFNKLIDLDENNKFYGQLATKWTAPDDKTWVFDLVDGVKFHNGESFGPDDVVYTFERILDPKTASSYAPLYDAISKVEASGPSQVTFHLKTSFGPFLSNIANNGEIVNQAAIEAKDPSRNAVGTGSFEFVEWVRGDHSTLKKNDSYFESGKPYLDGIQFKFLNVDQSRIDAQQAGVQTPLEVEYLGLPQYPELLKTGEVMQQQLEAVGIKMNIKQVEVGVWFNAFVKRTYQITSAYQERTIDPDNFYALVIPTG